MNESIKYYRAQTGADDSSSSSIAGVRETWGQRQGHFQVAEGILGRVCEEALFSLRWSLFQQAASPPLDPFYGRQKRENRVGTIQTRDMSECRYEGGKVVMVAKLLSGRMRQETGCPAGSGDDQHQGTMVRGHTSCPEGSVTTDERHPICPSELCSSS